MGKDEYRIWDIEKGEWYGEGLGYDLNDISTDQILCNYYEFYEVMQFTTLYDKNNKKIFEGDICKTYTHGEGFTIDEVVFEEGSFIFRNPYKLSVELRGFKQDYIEVIGNKFENPELWILLNKQGE